MEVLIETITLFDRNLLRIQVRLCIREGEYQ
jgi:hypothetical protein